MINEEVECDVWEFRGEERRRRMLRCYAEINGLRIELIRGKTLLKGQERRNNT